MDKLTELKSLLSQLKSMNEYTVKDKMRKLQMINELKNKAINMLETDIIKRKCDSTWLIKCINELSLKQMKLIESLSKNLKRDISYKLKSHENKKTH